MSAAENMIQSLQQENAHLRERIRLLEAGANGCAGPSSPAASTTALPDNQSHPDPSGKESDINATLVDLASQLLSSASFEEISAQVLHYARVFTQSPFGYAGYIEPTTGFLVCPTMTLDVWEKCQIPDKTIVFETFAGLWGWVLQQRQPLLCNDVASDDRSTGLPPGHIPIERFLSAPSLAGTKLVGQLALANAPRDYTEQDMEVVTRLADLYALAIQHKQDVQALQASEARYRTLVDLLPGAILLTRLDGSIRFCNHQAKKLFGCPDEQTLYEKNITDLIVPDSSLVASAELVGWCIQARELKDVECTMWSNTGEKIPVSLNSSVLTEQQGQPVALIIAIQDISAYKNAEMSIQTAYASLKELNEHLRESRNLLRSLFDGLEDGLMLLQQRGMVVIVNRAMATLFGSTPDELIGANWTDLFARILLDTPDCLQSSQVPTAQPCHERIRYRDPSGAVRIVDFKIIGLSGPQQTVEYVIVHTVDVTENVQLQARVIQNEGFAASGRLAASVAHEINTPIQSLHMLLDLAQIASEQDRATFIAESLEEVERVGNIVHQLLDLYRPAATQLGPVALPDLIERILLLIGKRIRDQNVTVECDIAADAPPVLQGRSDELMQVCINLMTNALDAMPEGGILTIRCKIQEAFSPQPQPGMAGDTVARLLILQIGDTGCGISPALQEHIFDSFVTTKEHGTGLGLAITAQIVQQYGGEITVDSLPGVGSTFTITLPCL
jgi:PAS domain S-box-containing protein